MTLATVLAGMSIGSALFNDGPIANIVEARQSWPKQYAKQMNKYFLIAPTIGITLGATIAGVMLKSGRRKAMLVFPLIGVLGSVLSVLDSYTVMILGKFLFGLGAGVCITVAPKVLEETIPPEYFDKFGFGAMTNVGVDIMILLNTIMVLLMPQEGHKWPTKDGKVQVTKEILAQSDLYKYLYLVPVPLFGIAFLLAIMCFRRETPGFYLLKKNKEQAVRALR
jgi:MFS family permease